MLPSAPVQLLSTPPRCQLPLPPLTTLSNLGPAAPSQKLKDRPSLLIRLTWPATEVWTGAAGKTREALAALGLVLPLIGELGGVRAQRVLARITPEAVLRAAEGALKLEDWLGLGRPAAHALGQHNEDLIAAHRTVQLSADRAGLIACRDLGAALRAVLLLRNEYRSFLEASRERGLFGVLERDPADNPALADLRIRARALVAFYLSTDFAVLTREPRDK